MNTTPNITLSLTLTLGLLSGAAHAQITEFNASAINDLNVVNGINDLGEVVGKIPSSLTSTGREHAAYWYNGSTTDLGIIGCRSTVTFCWSMAHDINNGGRIVGESFTHLSWPSMYNWPWAMAYPHDVIWNNKDSSPQHIRSLGHEYAHAVDVNETGQHVGWARSMDWFNSLGDRFVHGYVWFNNNTYYEIGSYGQYSKALAINDAVQATGEIDNGGFVQAFIWDNNVTTIIGHLGGYTSTGKDISNDASPKIVGHSKNGSGYNRAFVWQSGTMTDLGTLAGSASSQAVAINDSGLIGGNSGGKAVVWQSGGITDINTMLSSSIGTQLTNVIALNESSQIVAIGANGQYYLLTPNE